MESLSPSNPDKHSKFLGDVEARLLLLYTGKPRLAKNLLQNVVGRSIQKHIYSIYGMSFQIRNWYGGDSDLVETFKENHQLAGECWTKVRRQLHNRFRVNTELAAVKVLASTFCVFCLNK